MRVGKQSWRFKKPWSPAVGDPRFRRVTPDKLYARLQAAEHAHGVGHGLVGMTSTWVGLIYSREARKLAVYNPRRKELLTKLNFITESVEAAAGLAALEGNMDSPAPIKAFMGPEIQQLCCLNIALCLVARPVNSSVLY